MRMPDAQAKPARLQASVPPADGQSNSGVIQSEAAEAAQKAKEEQEEGDENDGEEDVDARRGW